MKSSKNAVLERVDKLLKKKAVQQTGAAMLALLVVSTIAYVGTYNKPKSSAATPGTLYASPVSGTFAPGSTISVDIREESGLDPVNSIQAVMTYNATQLQFVSVTDSATFPFAAATSTATPGEIRLARGVNSGTPGVTGDNLVASVTFRVLASSGVTAVGFNNALSLIVRSTDSTNIMTGSTGANYTIQFPAPAITSVAPTSGGTAGGTALTITGSNFRSGATVTVGGVAATGVVVVSANTITAVAPPHAAGSVSVVVTNSDGQSATRTAAFTYALPAPTITAVTPATGSTLGGNGIVITGTNFVSGATVTVGGTAATGVSFVSAGQINAVVPARATAGAVSVVVTNPDGQTVTRVTGYTYISTAPTIAALSVNNGFTGGNNSLTITGTNFNAASSVTFGGTPAVSVSFVSATTLNVVIPARAATGVVAVAVTNTDGQTGSLANAYTYRLGGDSNGDGRVNGIDYSVLAEHDGQNFAAADYNGDGVVGAADLAILLGNWTW